MPDVVIAEDDPILLSVLTECVLTEGYAVHATANGADAWQIVMTRPIDLIITDHRLPGMTGGHLCHGVATTPALAHIPLIVLSASPLAELSTLCPAAMLLTKPFDLDDLLELVHILCPVPA